MDYGSSPECKAPEYGLEAEVDVIEEEGTSSDKV